MNLLLNVASVLLTWINVCSLNANGTIHSKNSSTALVPFRTAHIVQIIHSSRSLLRRVLLTSRSTWLFTINEQSWDKIRDVLFPVHHVQPNSIFFDQMKVKHCLCFQLFQHCFFFCRRHACFCASSHISDDAARLHYQSHKLLFLAFFSSFF